MRQALILTIDSLAYRRIFPSLGLDDLILWLVDSFESKGIPIYAIPLMMISKKKTRLSIYHSYQIATEFGMHRMTIHIVTYSCFDCPGNKVHGVNMGPTWVLSAPDGPHVGPKNLAIRMYITHVIFVIISDRNLINLSDGSSFCQCSLNDAVLRVDEGQITNTNRFPMTQLRLGDIDIKGVEYLWQTLGPLVCFIGE